MEINVTAHAFSSEREPRIRHFRLNETPIPLARPRFAGTHCWDGQKQHKLIVGLSLREQMHQEPLFEGPIAIDVTFYFPVPSRLTLKRTKELQGKPHSKTPDLDNLIKFICDVGSQIIYNDDALIASINAKKVYGEPGTYLIITELL